MKEIDSLNRLKDTLKLSSELWLLLHKKGSPQSDCALESYTKVASDNDDMFLCTADVNHVRDIHIEFGITSVPTLMKFKNEKLQKLIKGCQQPAQLQAILSGKTIISNSGQGNKAQKNVVVYTTPTCSWCTTVKRHFDAHGISYREINVAADAKAAEAMVRKSGQQGVPQTEINGQIVVGFDKTKINSLLGIN